jgi:hypothetical protein
MKQARHVLGAIAAAGVVLGAAPVLADRGTDFKARLKSLNEVPSVVTGASGKFEGDLNRAGDQIAWELRYEGLEGTVTQAHIHVGQRHTNGGISVFFCTNLGNGPAGTQACPPSPARISGTFTAADVVGPAGQGVSPGEFADLLKALKAGAAYANVHSTLAPGGEIRGQIEGDD